MAEELEPTGLFTASTTGRYPWDEWLNGKPHRADSTDFAPSTAYAFQTNLYNAAKRRDLKVVTCLEPGGSVVFQSYGADEPRPVLPTPHARTARGKPEPAAPLKEQAMCSICGARLNGYGRPFGRCFRLDIAAMRVIDVHAADGTHDGTDESYRPGDQASEDSTETR